MKTLLQINTSLFSAGGQSIQQVRAFLNLLGMTEVEFVYAEGLNIDADTRNQGLHAARQHGAQLAQSPAYA